MLEPGAPAPLAPGAETVVDPASTFEIVLRARVPDARLVLLDAAADAQVAATGATEVGDTTTLSLAPTAPLVPAARYVLRLDGVHARELHDASGRPYSPVSYPLLAAGSPPPPTPKRKPPRRARRR